MAKILGLLILNLAVRHRTGYKGRALEIFAFANFWGFQRGISPPCVYMPLWQRKFVKIFLDINFFLFLS